MTLGNVSTKQPKVLALKEGSVWKKVGLSLKSRLGRSEPKKLDSLSPFEMIQVLATSKLTLPELLSMSRSLRNATSPQLIEFINSLGLEFLHNIINSYDNRPSSIVALKRSTILMAKSTLFKNEVRNQQHTIFFSSENLQNIEIGNQSCNY